MESPRREAAGKNSLSDLEAALLLESRMDHEARRAADCGVSEEWWRWLDQAKRPASLCFGLVCPLGCLCGVDQSLARRDKRMGEAQASDHFTKPNCFDLSVFASIIPIVSILGVASSPLTFPVTGAVSAAHHRNGVCVGWTVRLQSPNPLNENDAKRGSPNQR